MPHSMRMTEGGHPYAGILYHPRVYQAYSFIMVWLACRLWQLFRAMATGRRLPPNARCLRDCQPCYYIVG